MCKTTAVFFPGRYMYGCRCYLHLYSQQYIVAQCRTSWFLESVLTTWSAAMLANITPVYFVVYGFCNQRFPCHRSYACTCLNHELQTTLVGEPKNEARWTKYGDIYPGQSWWWRNSSTLCIFILKGFPWRQLYTRIIRYSSLSPSVSSNWFPSQHSGNN